jgi:transketolase
MESPRMTVVPPHGPADPHGDLAAIARHGRLLVLEATNAAGAGHVGGPLSAMDILVALYTRIMRVRPQEPDWPDRDRFVLSKGHSAIGLYAAMALAGYFPEAELLTFDHAGSRLQGHPDVLRLPGLDASTGSLGQGISVGVGMALGARLRGSDFHTWVMLGDGEMQEGQVWESVQVAAKYQLGNLAIIVDRNGMQQYGWPLKPGEAHRGDRRDPFGDAVARGALEAFGWRVLEIDGHDFGQIIEACETARASGATGQPTAILAETVKGRGFSFTEGASSWHARAATADELAAARAELGEVAS